MCAGTEPEMDDLADNPPTLLDGSSGSSGGGGVVGVATPPFLARRCEIAAYLLN